MHSLFYFFFSQTASNGGGAQGLGQMMLPLLAIIAVFYFIMIRPQQKQAKKLQAFIGGLKKGDEVYTQSGIIGKVASVEDRAITLDVGAGNKIRFLKAQIAGQWIENPTAVAEAKK